MLDFVKNSGKCEDRKLSQGQVEDIFFQIPFLYPKSLKKLLPVMLAIKPSCRSHAI